MDVSKLLKVIRGISLMQVKEVLKVTLRKPKMYPKYLKYGFSERALSGNVITGGGKGFDHLELSGKTVSGIITYGADALGVLKVYRHMAFPTLRLKPNLTFCTFCTVFEPKNEIYVDGVEVVGDVLKAYSVNGILTLESDFKGGLDIKRELYPSGEHPAFIERVEVTNRTGQRVNIVISSRAKLRKVPAKKCVGSAIAYQQKLVGENGDFRSELPHCEISKMLVPGGTVVHYVVYYALPVGETMNFNAAKERAQRERSIGDFAKNFAISVGDDCINAMYHHALIRSYDGLNETPKGLVHSPGGGRYYGAIWTNDQMEYAVPLFAFLNNRDGIAAAKNCIAAYEEYMDRSEIPFSEKKAVPSSLVGGCLHPIGVAGDRGDCAMAGCGTAQFLLMHGDIEYAKEKLWTVEWCVDFCMSRKTADGVIASDSDELENRLPSGKCNLSTNILTYQLLHYAYLLERELGFTEKAAAYLQYKEELRDAIKKYFEAMVEGYSTYRYYEGNSVLRSWIVLPIVAKIFDRKEGTLDAVFKELYADGKMKSASNREIYWDRSLLYALKACFIAGEGDRAFSLLADYSKSRTTGLHVPYAYEAFPEGNGSHLSAESILYLRIITEGLFGIEPVGFGKIIIDTKAPADVGTISIKGLICADTPYSLESDGAEISVKVGNKTYTGKNGSGFDFKSLTFFE